MSYPVLFMIQHLHQGGTEDHFCDLILGLDREKIEPRVIHFNNEFGINAQKLAAQPGIRRTFIPVNKAYDWSGLKAIWQIRRYLRRERVAAVVTFHFVADFIGAAAAWGRGGPPVISSRRDTGFTRTARQIQAGRFLARGVSRFIAVSEAVRGAVARDEKVSPARIEVIYNGIDPEELAGERRNLAAERARIGIMTEEVVIGCVANFNPVKKHLTLLVAFSRLKALCPEIPLKLLLVGDGPMRSAIEVMRHDLGLEQDVVLAGHRRNPSREFQLSDIFVLASETEGFSNAVVQAMGYAKPVVATRVGGNPEAVVEEETGLLVEPGDPIALATALSRLVKDPNARRRMGEAGRERARRCFSKQRMIKQTEDLILRVIGRNAGESGMGILPMI